MAKARFDLASSFVVRSPLLPHETWTAFGKELAFQRLPPEPTREALTQALEADAAAARKRLTMLLERPEVLEALYLASPSLVDSLGVWKEKPTSERGQRVEASLVRYVARMSSRSTPFGLFAGTAVGTFGAKTQLTLDPLERYQRHTRIDAGYLDGVTQKLAQDPGVRGKSRFFPNSSLYELAEQLRYVEIQTHQGARRYSLASVDASEAILGTVERARAGATLEALATALCADPEISREDADAFLQSLVDLQVLVPELEPHVTGPEPIHGLLSTLHGLGEVPSAKLARDTLASVQQSLETLDRERLGQPKSRYEAMSVQLDALPLDKEAKALFQVDLVKSGALSLGPPVQRQIQRAFETLDLLIPSVTEDATLTAFCRDFEQRYGEREVRLVDALDEDTGIGFGRVDSPAAEPSPLLRDLPWAGGESEGTRLGAREDFLLRKIQDAEARGAHELELDFAKLPPYRPGDPPKPAPSIAINCALRARSKAALEKGDVEVHVEASNGPSGARLLGRFCHTDPLIHALVTEQLRAEEKLDPDAVYAEIVHLPEGRMGNILQRPVLRDYEIVYLGRSGAEVERQLPVTDLLLRVREGKVQLRSKRLDKPVVPRLTNAHNVGLPSNLALYKFLSRVTAEGGATGRMFDWGALSRLPHLPRVRQGPIVVSLEEWRLGKEEIESIRVEDPVERFARVQALRKTRNLPRRVVWAEYDNTLPVDLDHVLSVNAFVTALAGRVECVLKEAWEEEWEPMLEGPEGHFTHELTVPAMRQQPVERRAPRLRSSTSEIVERYAPGSEWLFAKVYCGTAAADRLLPEVIAPLVQQVLDAGHARSFFFIRYADLEPHLRLRFRGEPQRLLAEVMPRLSGALAPMMDAGRVAKLMLDTYDRETERYGGPAAIALVEDLFANDSLAVLRILSETSSESLPEARWRIALRGSQGYFDAFGLTAEKRREMARRMRSAYHTEFQADAAMRQKVSERFRPLRNELEALLRGEATDELAPGLAALEERSQRDAPIVEALRSLEREGKILGELDHIIPSLIHMHCIRLIRGAPRAHELVLYDFLDRIYGSAAVRS